MSDDSAEVAVGADQSTDDVGQPCPECGRPIMHAYSKSRVTGKEKSGYYCICGWIE